jgi:vacuolar-type H+-ATPase subunit I/STV1
MQRDHLEQFIIDRREAFDDAVPGLNVWSEINSTLDERKQKKVLFLRVAGIAASVVALLVCGALIGSHYTQQQYANDPLVKVAPQYVELEKQYQDEINRKYQQLVSYNHAGIVDKDLSQLDEVMDELRQELLTAPRGKEMEIVESLLKSYQTKVDILERVLDRLQTGSPEQEKTQQPDEEVSI